MNSNRLSVALLLALAAMCTRAFYNNNANIPGTSVADYRFGGLFNVPTFLQQPYFLAAKAGCPIKDEPVCGVDGKTYQNSCFLKQAGVSIAYEGWCVGGKDKNKNKLAPELMDPLSETEESGFLRYGEPISGSCPCNDNYYPVCSDRGVTYANLCRAKCLGAIGVSVGPCYNFYYKPQDNLKCTCGSNQEPVCAVSGITYENSCVLKCAGDEFQGINQCVQKCNCVFVFKPVCGVDGRNYVNACELNCANVQKAFDGKCENSRSQKCIHCIGDVSPVCGNDGRTYDNLCYLKCAGVEFARDGNCLPSQPEGQCVCPKVFLPVCSSDNTTFDNDCLARCAGKKVAYNGACKVKEEKPEYNSQDHIDSCLTSCGKFGSQPICGSDGRTYGNHCALGCHSVLGVHVHKQKPCKPVIHTRCPCNTELKPVCGVDGKTYLNICTIQCSGINKAWDGPCAVVGNYGYIMSQYYKGKTGAGSFSDEKSHSDSDSVVKLFKKAKSRRDHSHSDHKVFKSQKSQKKSAHRSVKPQKSHKKNAHRSVKPHKSHKKNDRKKGFLLKLPFISTVPDKGDRLTAQQNDKTTCPALEDIIQSLYPGLKVKDPRNFKGLAAKDEQTKKEVVQNPINIFVLTVSAEKANEEYKEDKFEKQEKVVEKKEGDKSSYYINNAFEMIPEKLKKKVGENPYLYYTYFYSLLHYGKVMPDTIVDNQCRVKDILIYICLDFFNIKLKLETSNKDEQSDHEDKGEEKSHESEDDKQTKVTIVGGNK